MHSSLLDSMPDPLDQHTPDDCAGCPLITAETAPRADFSRRDFVSAAMLAAIAATLAACGNGELTAAEKLLAAGDSTTPSTPTPTPTPTPTGTPTVGANQFGVTVANYAALASVGGVAVVRSSPAIALARTSYGFVAYSLRCPHEGTTVSVLSNNTLRCPNHGALFASTGSWSGGYRTGSLSARTVTASADLSFVVVNLT